jgi:sec-independent protein translocase protein TatB
MFNIGASELAFILIIALIVLGPQRLPELARGIGKFIREFRRQTEDVRSVVEREFYRMDQELQLPEHTAPTHPPPGEGKAAEASGEPPLHRDTSAAPTQIVPAVTLPDHDLHPGATHHTQVQFPVRPESHDPESVETQGDRPSTVDPKGRG